MRIIVEDVQEAIDVAGLLQMAADAVCLDMELNEIERASLFEEICTIRDSIKVEEKDA